MWVKKTAYESGGERVVKKNQQLESTTPRGAKIKYLG